MDWITTSGRTLDEAKSNALDQLGIVADEAEFDVVNDVEKGLFGRVKTEAKIRARVRPKQPAAKDDRGNRGRNRNGGNRNRKGSGGNRGGRGREKGGEGNNKNNDGDSNDNRQKAKGKSKGQQNKDTARSGGDNDNRNRNANKGASKARNQAPKTEKKKETVEATISREDQESTAQSFLEGVLGAFGMTGDVAVSPEAADDGAIEMTVSGDELGLLVGQKGLTLNALQELTRTVVQRKADGAKTDRLRVDVAGYRARRTVALQDFSRKIAEDVLESGSEKLLEPMGPADRKVVHDTVNSIDGVETGSEGEEPRRRVVIRPV